MNKTTNTRTFRKIDSKEKENEVHPCKKFTPFFDSVFIPFMLISGHFRFFSIKGSFSWN